MHWLLCTIGFTGKTAEEFFTLLTNAGVRQVIDIRQNRSGQLSAFAKHPDLAYRRLVANLLAAFWREHGDDVEIRHLISSRQKPAKPRRKSAGIAP